MQLLTEELRAKLPKLGSTESIPCEQKKFYAKFFNPMGRGTWLVAEGEEQTGGDWTFFGLVDLYESEWGYFTLSELESVDVGFGLGIERDICFGPSADHPEWVNMA